MKIINIGILAHVDAGKTTVTESLLFKSGAIPSPGRVDKGTTKTDSMPIERQRGITVRAATISFECNGTKVNMIDTPGHMDFIAEVERSLSVLDAAILVISAKEGVQVQTRVIFHALGRLKIPTLLFINKIDRLGVCLEEVYSQIGDRLTPDFIVMQKAGLEDPDHLTLENCPLNSDGVSEALLNCDDRLAEKYILGETITQEEYRAAFLSGIASCGIYPVYHGAALRHVGTAELLRAITEDIPSGPASGQESLCAYVYKVDRDEGGRRRAFLRVFGGCLDARRLEPVEGRNTGLKIRNLEILQKGGMVPCERAFCNDIAVVPDTDLRVGEVIGRRIPRIPEISMARPPLQASVLPVNPEDRGRLIQTLLELSQEDPMLDCSVDGQTEEIAVHLFGKVQMEVLGELIEERCGIPVQFQNLIIFYKERPRKPSEAVIHMAVPPNPYWASVGLSIEPLPVGSGLVYETEVSYGYLHNSFQSAVEEGVRSALRQGLFGWEVTDLKVRFVYGLYSSPVSTPSDFRHLTPYVFEKALMNAGTELLEPFSRYELQIPKEYGSRAMYDIQLMRGSIEEIQAKGEEICLRGRIPLETSESYQAQLVSYTNGRGIFMTEPDGYAVYTGKPVFRKRQTNPDSDKLRNLFLKKS